MSSKHLFLYMLIFEMIFVSSCTKTAEGIPGPAGVNGIAGKPVGDQRTAIFGYVLQVNQFTDTDTILDQVKVTTVMGDSALSVQTDKTGKFILPALRTGTYRIMFNRPGFDSIGINVNHSAGNEDQFVGITQIDGSQTTRFVSQSLQLLPSPFDNFSDYLDLHTTMTGPPISNTTMRYMDIYFSNSPNLNSHNSLYVFNTYTHNEGNNITDAQVFFGGSEINSTRFQPGDTVYMKSYFVPPYSLNTSWFDTRSYQTLAYPYVGDSLSNFFIWQTQ